LKDFVEKYNMVKNLQLQFLVKNLFIDFKLYYPKTLSNIN